MDSPYDWKTHYDVPLKTNEDDGVIRTYYLNDDPSAGKVMFCSILPGVQMIYNDLHVQHCGRSVPPSDRVIEINYCYEGRYECSVNDRYIFYVGPRDFSVGTVGRMESHGGFPTKRFRGISLFVEPEKLRSEAGAMLDLLEIDLSAISSLAVRQPRYYVLRGKDRIDSIFLSLSDDFQSNCLPIWRAKVMELLVLLSLPEISRLGEKPRYLNRGQVILAKKIQNLIVEDLSRQLTLHTLSERLGVGQTALKTSFKGVLSMCISAPCGCSWHKKCCGNLCCLSLISRQKSDTAIPRNLPQPSSRKQE